jgi:hypothetical protein
VNEVWVLFFSEILLGVVDGMIRKRFISPKSDGDGRISHNDVMTPPEVLVLG